MGKLIPFLILSVLCIGWWLLSRRPPERVAPGRTEPSSPTGTEPPTASATETYHPAAKEPARPAADEACPPAPELPSWRPAIRAELSAEAIVEAQADVAAFPELPVGARQIILALQNPQTEPQQIARLAASDPALAARILRVVNSALFRLPNKVGDLSRAVVLLGYSQVRGLVVRGGMGQELVAQDERTEIDLTPFWFHSFCTATSAFQVAKVMGSAAPGLAATVGLLHDIGKPVLWWAHPGGGHARVAAAGAATDQSTLLTLRAEESAWAVNHPALGALIAVRWGLPTEVVRGIEYHHHPEFAPVAEIPPEARELALVIWVADHLAHWFATLGEEELAAGDLSGAKEIVRSCWETLGRGSPPPGLVDHALLRELQRARQLLEAADGEPLAASASSRC